MAYLRLVLNISTANVYKSRPWSRCSLLLRHSRAAQIFSGVSATACLPAGRLGVDVQLLAKTGHLLSFQGSHVFKTFLSIKLHPPYSYICS